MIKKTILTLSIAFTIFTLTGCTNEEKLRAEIRQEVQTEFEQKLEESQEAIQKSFELSNSEYENPEELMRDCGFIPLFISDYMGFKDDIYYDEGKVSVRAVDEEGSGAVLLISTSADIEKNLTRGYINEFQTIKVNGIDVHIGLTSDENYHCAYWTYNGSSYSVEAANTDTQLFNYIVKDLTEGSLFCETVNLNSKTA